MSDDPRPVPPEAPLPGDCCGGGCMPCILDVHDEAMREHHERLLAWMLRHPPSVPVEDADSKRSPPTRLVLDTNVSLDLIVFRDPRWKLLGECIAQGSCEAVMRHDCRQEFVRVLSYPQFDLDAARRVRALQAFDAMHRFRDGDAALHDASASLPQCGDPDDQKFMELALETGADTLLSKDKALLKLARRNKRLGLFEILSPQAWLQRWQTSAPEA
jgi:predicted nucleic acid-binding protein